MTTSTLALDRPRAGSVAWAQHIALVIERKLRATDDADERARLRELRDWHFAQVTNLPPDTAVFLD